jgi:hypothetical protein
MLLLFMAIYVVALAVFVFVNAFAGPVVFVVVVAAAAAAVAAAVAAFMVVVLILFWC